MKTLLPLKPTLRIGQMAMIALILFSFNPSADAQTSNFKMQNVRAEIMNAKGGLCGNEPKAYGNNFNGYLFF